MRSKFCAFGDTWYCFHVLSVYFSMTWRILKYWLHFLKKISRLVWLEMISPVAPGVCKRHQDVTCRWPLFFALAREFPYGWLKVFERKAIKWPSTIAWILGPGLILIRRKWIASCSKFRAQKRARCLRLSRGGSLNPFGLLSHSPLLRYLAVPIWHRAKEFWLFLFPGNLSWFLSPQWGSS